MGRRSDDETLTQLDIFAVKYFDNQSVTLLHSHKVTQSNIHSVTHSDTQLATEFDYSGCFFANFKDRLPSEKKTSFNQVHLGTVFANLLSPSFMCIMLVMPE